MMTDSQIFCSDCSEEYGAGDSIFPLSDDRKSEIAEAVADGDFWRIICPRCKSANVSLNVRLVPGVRRPNGEV
jgi:Zn finger protein HypA/HybF involved in hydrogenase expression